MSVPGLYDKRRRSEKMTYSVVVPVYNKRPHVRRALESVLAQESSDFELIVIDDASTDGSDQEIAAFSASIHVHLRRQTPGPGGYAARNLGVSRSSASWIAFLDADDKWEPGHLSQLSRLREQFPTAGVLATAYRDVEDDGSVQMNSYYRAQQDPQAHTLSLLDYLRSVRNGALPYRTSGFAIRKELFDSIGGFPEGRCRRGGDNDLFLRSMVATTGAWSPEATVTYFRNSVNMNTRRFPPEPTSCIEPTVADLLPRQPSAEVRHELKRVVNFERKNGIKRRIRSGTLRLKDLRGLYFAAEPGYALYVILVALAPGILQRGAVSFLRTAKRLLRRTA